MHVFCIFMARIYVYIHESNEKSNQGLIGKCSVAMSRVWFLRLLWEAQFLFFHCALCRNHLFSSNKHTHTLKMKKNACSFMSTNHNGDFTMIIYLFRYNTHFYFVEIKENLLYDENIITISKSMNFFSRFQVAILKRTN